MLDQNPVLFEFGKDFSKLLYYLSIPSLAPSLAHKEQTQFDS